MAKKAVAEGEVLLRSEAGATQIDFYEETFLLSDEVDSLGEARRLIRRGLITERLRKKVKGFKSVRTCQIVEFEDSKESAENSELDKLLTEAIKLNCVPANIDNYKRPDYKLKALEKAIEAEKKRQASLKKKGSNVQDMGYVD